MGVAYSCPGKMRSFSVYTPGAMNIEMRVLSREGASRSWPTQSVDHLAMIRMTRYPKMPRKKVISGMKPK